MLEKPPWAIMGPRVNPPTTYAVMLLGSKAGMAAIGEKADTAVPRERAPREWVTKGGPCSRPAASVKKYLQVAAEYKPAQEGI
jgi:hypothetical protein